MIDVPENTSTSFSSSRFSPNQDTLVYQVDRVLVPADFHRVLLDQDYDPVSVDHHPIQPVSVHRESNHVHVNLHSRHAAVCFGESSPDGGVDGSLVLF